MTPFVLKKFDQVSSAYRELRDTEIEAVFGGLKCPNEGGESKSETLTVTGEGSKDDGCDEN